MRYKLHAIVLGTVRCTDRADIVRLYTDRLGLVSFLSPRSNTAAGRMRRALLMPLQAVTLEATLKAGSELARFHDLQRWMATDQIYLDPVKSALAMFVAEVLTHCIQEREENELLFNYISTSVQLLDGIDRGVANFHLCFLYGLGRLLGIEPDVGSYHEGYWMDMLGGTFAPSPQVGGKWLRPAEAAVVWRLSRMTYANMHLYRFSHTQRTAILDQIIAYMRMHNASLGTLKSPQVLASVFA